MVDTFSCQHTEKFFLWTQPRIDEDGAAFRRTQGVDALNGHIPLGKLRIFFHQETVCFSAGIIAVVKNPHLHVQLFRLVQKNCQILPPVFLQIIRMRSGFHNKAADSVFLHPLKFFSQYRFLLMMLPEKRTKMAFFCTHMSGYLLFLKL